jgi:hypothetical protein
MGEIHVHAGVEIGFTTNIYLIFKSSSKTGDYSEELKSEKYLKGLNEKPLCRIYLQLLKFFRQRFLPQWSLLSSGA